MTNIMGHEILQVMKSKQANESRFWAKVRKTEGCWLWTEYTYWDGYGRFYLGRKEISAHRFSWELHNGPIPEELCVLHHCDVRACVNPAHMFLGTNADNVADRDAKGRQAQQKGEAHGNAKLNNDQVLDIRSRQGQSLRALAKEFGVCNQHISDILKRHCWAHL